MYYIVVIEESFKTSGYLSLQFFDINMPFYFGDIISMCKRQVNCLLFKNARCSAKAVDSTFIQ